MTWYYLLYSYKFHTKLFVVLQLTILLISSPFSNLQIRLIMHILMGSELCIKIDNHYNIILFKYNSHYKTLKLAKWNYVSNIDLGLKLAKSNILVSI